MYSSPGHGNASRILIVDDDRDTVESMACLLRHYGHEVEVAFEGQQAIEIAHQQQPAYVLLDLAMPGLNGYQVAARLREEVPGPPVLIAVTGYGQTEDRQRALASGFDHHFIKPVELAALIGVLSSAGREDPAATDDLRQAGQVAGQESGRQTARTAETVETAELNAEKKRTNSVISFRVAHSPEFSAFSPRSLRTLR